MVTSFSSVYIVVSVFMFFFTAMRRGLGRGKVGQDLVWGRFSIYYRGSPKMLFLEILLSRPVQTDLFYWSDQDQGLGKHINHHI